MSAELTYKHLPSKRQMKFIDITEEEQASELRAYMRSKGADISQEKPAGGLHADLAQIIDACHVCFKGDDRDVESVMNSVVHLLNTLGSAADEQESLVESLCEKLVTFRGGERAALRTRLLSNLFRVMDGGPVRFTLLCSLIRVAATCDAVSFLPTDLPTVRTWIADWNLTADRKHALLRLLSEALYDCKQSEPAAEVMLELLGSDTEEEDGGADATRCIIRALKDPNAFLFDHLLALKPVRLLEGQLIHDLLAIFVSAKLAAYVQFYQKSQDFVDRELSHEQNMAKMRLLTFMDMAVESKVIPFDAMQRELQIGAGDVEAFVIDAVQTKMVCCRIDQTRRQVVVSQSMYRAFGKQQWQQLFDRVTSLKANLTTVKSSLETLSPFA